MIYCKLQIVKMIVLSVLTTLKTKYVRLCYANYIDLIITQCKHIKTSDYTS
jgi:hypothetical protein